jgi:citrate lyase beta subunit
MPTLETKDIFDLNKLYVLRDYLVDSPLNSRILALRIGALDLLSILGLKRDINLNIYDTPLGHVVDQLITVFKPAGFALTAPAYEGLEKFDTLLEELTLDVSRGLYGKTALHPGQISFIHRAYMVDMTELKMAEAIQDPERPAVFRLWGRMMEKAVHANWAATIIERARIYGVHQLNTSTMNYSSSVFTA